MGLSPICESVPSPPRAGRVHRLAIIVPTRNESGNIAPLIERIEAALGGCDWEALVVDDHSPDGTADEARALANKGANVRVIERIGRRGLSGAVIEGITANEARYIAVIDADHQHDPALLPQMLARAEAGGADLVIASRFAKGASVHGLAGAGRLRMSRIGNVIARRLLGRNLSDPISGFFLIRGDLARSLAPKLRQTGFKVLLEILAHSGPLRIEEIALNLAPRRAGTSKFGPRVGVEFIASCLALIRARRARRAMKRRR